MSNIRIIHGDCMEAIKAIPDKAYELAICDPPYGIGDKFKGGKTGKMQFNEIVNKQWDIAPTNKYFTELFRTTKNQIIWGMNYFVLPQTRGVICWDKVQPWENFSQIELAWTSFDYPAKLFRYDNRTGGKIHPTQKPVALYQWLLKNYAKPGDKILDTHGGSCSIAIACDIMGFDADIWEIDADYYRAAVERFERHKQQTKLEFV